MTGFRSPGLTAQPGTGDLLSASVDWLPCVLERQPSHERPERSDPVTGQRATVSVVLPPHFPEIQSLAQNRYIP